MCPRRKVDRTLTPAFLPGRPSRAHDNAAKIPSCALPTPPRMQLRRNREFVSNPVLLRRHLFLCLHTRVLHRLAASLQEPHPAASARALVRIECASKRGQSPRHLRQSILRLIIPSPKSEYPWLLNPHHWSAFGRPQLDDFTTQRSNLTRPCRFS